LNAQWRLCGQSFAQLCRKPSIGGHLRRVGRRREEPGSLGEIDDVAPLVAFLCGRQARWITAQTLRVNGGMA
jgi:NAD(P)-dependent dehydrogenase (short-subunit alcohol dehydrogenase family)